MFFFFLILNILQEIFSLRTYEPMHRRRVRKTNYFYEILNISKKLNTFSKILVPLRFNYIKTHHKRITKIIKYTLKIGKLLCEASNMYTYKIGNYREPGPITSRVFFQLPITH